MKTMIMDNEESLLYIPNIGLGTLQPQSDSTGK